MRNEHGEERCGAVYMLLLSSRRNVAFELQTSLMSVQGLLSKCRILEKVRL